MEEQKDYKSLYELEKKKRQKLQKYFNHIDNENYKLVDINDMYKSSFSILNRRISSLHLDILKLKKENERLVLFVNFLQIRENNKKKFFNAYGIQI